MRILVVDDEPQITRVLRASLASSGYEVVLARDGMKAFDSYRESAPDLVITDLSMPRMDGIELTRAIRQMGDTPIIVLSVREQETMKVAALRERTITLPSPSACRSFSPGFVLKCEDPQGSRRRRRKSRSAISKSTRSNIASACEGRRCT
jgi:CheY-like chemotaxis protein